MLFLLLVVFLKVVPTVESFAIRLLFDCTSILEKHTLLTACCLQREGTSTVITPMLTE
jgi:hypothetical protein